MIKKIYVCKCIDVPNFVITHDKISFVTEVEAREFCEDVTNDNELWAYEAMPIGRYGRTLPRKRACRKT